MMRVDHAGSSETRGGGLPRGDEDTKGRPPVTVRELCTMSDQDFARLSEFIQASCGIKLPPVKKTMLEGRLRKRLQALGLGSFGRYCDYLFSGRGLDSEYIHMLDAITTNKTDFFREPDHFEYLSARVLPELVGDQGFGLRERLNVWSAGC